MKVTRHAIAVWEGTGKDGKGLVSTQSKILDQSQVSYKSRFESGIGTNPEELVAAAHASCFSMKLAFILSELGFPPVHLEAKADVDLNDGQIDQILLVLKAKVPGISSEEFQKAAENAKRDCPISKLLNAEVILTATLE